MRRGPGLRPAIALLGLTLLAFGVRCLRLDFFSLRGDEAFTVLFVQQPWGALWVGIRTVEPNPPLLYLLLRGWIAAAGASEFATRFFSLWFGVLCVPLIYRLGRATLALPEEEASGTNRMALLAPLFAALLVAINPYQIFHSQDVRNYTLWPALSLAGLIPFLGWVKAQLEEGARGRARLALAAYTVLTLASLYTHYYDAFIVLAENLFVAAVLWRRWRSLGEWAAAQIALAAAYLPWPLVFSDRVGSYGEGSGLQGLGFLEIARRSFASIVIGETLPESLRAVGWVPFALLALWAWYRVLAPRRPRAAAWLLLYAGAPALAVYGLNLFRPLFLERYLNGIAPAVYLLLGIGAAALVEWAAVRLRVPARKSVAVAALGAALLFTLSAAPALGNYFTNPAYSKSPDWRALAQTIAAQGRSGDVILQNFPEMASFFYFRGTLPIEVLPRDFLPDARTTGQLQALAARYGRIWFVPAAPDFWDPDHAVQEWLESHTDLLQERRISTFDLRLYATAREFLPNRTPADVRVAEFARMVGYRLAQEEGRLRVSLYWQSTAQTERNYTVFAHALDANGKVIAQQDNPPARGTRPTKGWRPDEVVVDSYALAVGNWAALEVGMYDPATVQRLPLYDANGKALPENRVVIEPPR